MVLSLPKSKSKGNMKKVYLEYQPVVPVLVKDLDNRSHVGFLLGDGLRGYLSHVGENSFRAITMENQVLKPGKKYWLDRQKDVYATFVKVDENGLFQFINPVSAPHLFCPYLSDGNGYYPVPNLGVRFVRIKKQERKALGW